MHIYRIKEEELTLPEDKRMLEDHGYLWFRTNHSVNGGTERLPMRFYKSIATGHVHMWFDTEVEASEEESNDE